ncbi:MAG: Crp/Fnr family transcriptional regulator [Muribaculaceae bacterium]|nr:Crp/Fnr family transcriptional regulator [Muribaculaceae bacterium]
MGRKFNAYMESPEIDFWRRMCLSEGELRVYERGEEFVSVGEVGRHIGFVMEGTLKYVTFSEDGTEHVVGFEFPGEFVTDFPFSLYGMPARVSIVADSHCEIMCVASRTVAERMKEDPELAAVVMRSTEGVFSTVYDRYMSLYRKSPRERYEELLNRHPDLFSLFSLKDIASYLNITPTHLSRLRKNV